MPEYAIWVVANPGGQRYRGDSPLVTVPFDIVKRVRREFAEVISPLQFTVFSNFYGVIKTLCPFGLLQILCGLINLHALKRPHAEHIGRQKFRLHDLPYRAVSKKSLVRLRNLDISVSLR
jgi:hypothetical protein